MLKPDPSRLGSTLFRLIAKGEIVTYGYVAVLLLVIAGSISTYLIYYILNAMLLHQPFFSSLIAVINEILLILIVMEILRTVTRLPASVLEGAADGPETADETTVLPIDATDADADNA